MSDEDKNWILDYLCGGKGVLPYEAIISYEDLDRTPGEQFLAKTEFYNSLKNDSISDSDYEAVKKLWNLLKLKKLSELNDLYNFQDTIILCEIFENRASQMMVKFPYNSGKCTSASSLSGCIRRYLSNVIISLPTRTEYIDVFEKTLIGGFSCVTTRLSFDTSILFPRDPNGKRRKDLKLIYKIRNKDSQEYEDKQIVGKILKMDENNQYENAMAKPIPTGCIKKAKKAPSLRELNLLLEGISDEDKIGHLFIVDIIFHDDRATEKHYLSKEIYTPTFEKKKVLPPSERSVFQLLKTMRLNGKGILNSHKTTAKAYSMKKKTLFLCMQNTFIFLSKDPAGLSQKSLPTTLLNRVNSKNIL